MKPIVLAPLLIGLAASVALAQHTFTGDGNWLDPASWDMGIVAPDGSTAIVNGNALIDQEIVTNQSQNSRRARAS